MSWRDRIIKAHTDVTSAVSHYEWLKSDRYFVWQEDSRNDLYCGGTHIERAVGGTTDLYTKIEGDLLAEEFEHSLERYDIAFYKTSVQYEEDTRIIHHEWRWEVEDGED